MIKPIITDNKILAIPSKVVSDYDQAIKIIRDLLDTAKYYDEKKIGCSGLAANQIGFLERIIIIKYGCAWLPMINPDIYSDGQKTLSANEGCLSRPGVKKKVKRLKRIKIIFQTKKDITKKMHFRNFDARVIQHEIDHLDGKFI